jgi:hypothetical protein
MKSGNRRREVSRVFSTLPKEVPPGVYRDAIPLAGYHVVKAWDGHKTIEVYLATIECFDESQIARLEQRLAVHLAKQPKNEPTPVPTPELRLLA